MFTKMVSSLSTPVRFLWLVMVLHVTFLSSKLAVYSEEHECPHQCSCLSDSSVRSNVTCAISTPNIWDLTCQQLVNYTAPNLVTDLKIQGNLNSISEKLICLPELHSLDLSRTSLVLVDDIFHGLRIHSLLNISSNEIQNLPADVFSQLEHLHELDLSHNLISTFEPKTFKGLNSLKILHLGFNNLSVLSVESFSYIPSLEYLGLEYNRIQEFSSVYILHSLKSLNLQGNMLPTVITDVNGTDLYTWENLSSLDLSGNPIECSCALRNLYTLLPNLNNVLVNSSATTCITPERWKGRSILNVNKTELSCSVPYSVLSFPSSYKDILATSSITLQCQADGSPKPNIMWITPWKDKFFSGSQLLLRSQGLISLEDENVFTYREYREPNNIFMVSSIHLTSNNDLVITKIRGSMSGNYTCLVFNIVGNTSVEISLVVLSAMKTVVLHSFFLGGYCASGFLIFGFLIGFIRMLVVWLRHKLYFIVPMFSKSPSTCHTDDNCTSISFDVSLSKPDSDDRYFDDSTPDASILVQGNDLERSESPEKCDDQSEAHIAGGWLSHGIFDSFEEAKGRLRDGVGRKMERVRKNVQSMKESGSVYVHNIVESSSSAASRMKAGVVLGVETVKYHVQSFKELCGTGDMGMQTISMVSVETDVDSNQQKEIIKQITFV